MSIVNMVSSSSLIRIISEGSILDQAHVNSIIWPLLCPVSASAIIADRELTY